MPKECWDMGGSVKALHDGGIAALVAGNGVRRHGQRFASRQPHKAGWVKSQPLQGA